MKRLPLLSAHCLDRTVLSSVQRVDLWLSDLFVQFVSSVDFLLSIHAENFQNSRKHSTETKKYIKPPCRTGINV